MNLSLASIKKQATPEPPRIVAYAVEGWGKTSLFAHSKNPLYIMAKGETGLLTLMSAKQIPDTPHFPPVLSWGEARECIKLLMKDDHDYKTLVLDAAGGFEALCHEFVCNDKYNGDWSEQGFMSFSKGYEVAIPYWRDFLEMLDTLRVQRGMTVVLLAHCQVKPFNNPSGENYDRYQALMHAKTWNCTHAWADIVLFGNYYVPTEKKGGKHKATGSQERLIYTQRHAAYDAKNRHGLPPEIEIPDTGSKEAYETLRKAFIHG